jgi:indolepyruvate ferredoxin oxidoreductase alpha subunit
VTVIVIDASTAVSAALAPRELDVLTRHEVVAPALLWSEATSALCRLVSRDLLSAEDAYSALTRLLEARIERRSSRQLYEEAYAVARELGWAKAYDAEYVALARLLGCPLVTLDGRLRRGASKLAEIVGPTEL